MLSLMFLFGFITSVSSKTFYIRDGANGMNNGSDWENAWTSFPGSFFYSRGDTLFVADGDYCPNGHLFDKPETGVDYVSILKATVSEHGTNTGWQDSYGDGQASFTETIKFITGYWIWDGMYGAGADSTSYGFKITWDGNCDEHHLIGIPDQDYNTTQLDHISILHTALICPGMECGEGLYEQCPVYSYARNPENAAHDILIANNYLVNGSSNMKFRNWNNSIIENNYFGPNWSSPTRHGQQLDPGDGCNDMILRNNTFKDSSIGVLAIHNIKAYGDSTTASYRWKVYNNLVIGSQDIMTPWRLIEGSEPPDSWMDNDIHHNTHINVTCSGRGIVYVGTFTYITENRKTRFYNNLSYNCTNIGFNSYDGDPGAILNDFNSYHNCVFLLDEISKIGPNSIVDNENPFVDIENGDYNLRLGSSPVGKGRTDLDPLYDLDINGISRSEDGRIDIGAYETSFSIDQNEAPRISSVVISPKNDYVTAGDTVTITVTAADFQAGLTASPALINGQYIPLTDIGDGTYVGVYTVNESDPQGENIEATEITLTDEFNRVSEPASSTGSALSVDTLAPVINSITLDPITGELQEGDEIHITTIAAGSETGLSASPVLVGGESLTLADQGDGTYKGTYFITGKEDLEAIFSQAIFGDDFESGDLSKWSHADPGITIGDEGKHGEYCVECEISSDTQNNMYIDLPAEYDRMHTSFYFKIDPLFTMNDGDTIYIMTMRRNDGNVSWSLRLNRNGNGYFINVYYGGYSLGDWVEIEQGQWFWIKIGLHAYASGTAEWWLDGISRGRFSGNTENALMKKLYAFNPIGLSTGSSGIISLDHVQITQANHPQPGYFEAVDITLADEAGNVSMPVSSSGNSLVIKSSQDSTITGIWGDVSNDDYVDIVDAYIVAVYDIDGDSFILIDLMDFVLERGNVNADPYINIADALIIAAYDVDPENVNLPPLIGTPIYAVGKKGRLYSGDIEYRVRPQMECIPIDGNKYSVATSVKALNGALIGASSILITWDPDVLRYSKLDEDINHVIVNERNVSLGKIKMGGYFVDGLATFSFPSFIVEHVNKDVPPVLQMQVLNATESSTFRPMLLENDMILKTADEEAVPSFPVLHHNIPNPFNPSTVIRYNLPRGSRVELSIFNTSGQKITTLVDDTESAGEHAVTWNAVDDNGYPVASGIYLYRLSTDHSTDVKKMLLIR